MLGTGNEKEEETVPDLSGYVVAEGCVSVCECVCVCVCECVCVSVCVRWGGSDRTRTNPSFSVACHFTFMGSEKSQTRLSD